MSKYTEAEVLNAIKTMGLFRTSYPKDVVEKVVKNALKIVDRLEHMDENPKISSEDATVYDKLYDDGFAEGYNYACMVMRGDLEEAFCEVIETLEETNNED